jgi:class 3 adenylate cyclase/tetratricopeptide (TPR) repeat protein
MTTKRRRTKLPHESEHIVEVEVDLNQSIGKLSDSKTGVWFPRPDCQSEENNMDLACLYPYIPVDRRHSLFTGNPLPDRTHGAALFADISGFTPLTAALAKELGRQRGAEAMLDILNPIYDALIARLHEVRGSVIGFAGDSITCWLDDDDGTAAALCGLRMQDVMAELGQVTTPGGREVTLSVKIAVAAGPARRFLVGDPAVHAFEALAGTTLERMAAAEHVADKGDVVVSREVADLAGPALKIEGWRPDDDGELRFAVVTGWAGQPLPERVPWPALPDGSITEEDACTWIDAPVRERLASGATYLAELRPVTSLFLKFSGIDYDGDDAAGEKLDTFVRWVQQVLARYEGTMLQLTIGDKGSNLLAVFGAPVAHDDDDSRAVAAGLDLTRLPSELAFISPPKIGISRGLAWAGACGGTLRCIYTVMGDEVNMAARLMGQAVPGQVWVNQSVADTVSKRFRFEPLGGIRIKGRETPLPVSIVLGRQTNDVQGLRALFTGPLVGREEVLAALHTHLAHAREGQGQVLRLQGVAGVGKSHLAAVFAGQAAEDGWRMLEGTCQSITQGMAYTPWHQLLGALLGLGSGTPEAQAARLTTGLAKMNPAWLPRLPLLGDVLGLPLSDTGLTAGLDAQMRQQALFALVAEIVTAHAAGAEAGPQPVLLVLEDVHWLDEASAALTVAVARAVRRSAVALLLVQRPPLQADQPILPELDQLEYHHFVELGDLSPEGVAGLVENRLGSPVAPLALELIQAQGQGNPFFTEELVDTMCEAGYLIQDESGTWQLSANTFDALLDGECIERVVEDGEVQWRMRSGAALSNVAWDIPDTVNGTVLARMDRLPERHKLTLKVASVIGRTFGLRMLRDVHPGQPDLARLQVEVEEAGRRDFVRVETGDLDDPVYIFKHNTTQEVAYGTLLFAQRQSLHTAVADWYEQSYGGGIPLEVLTLEAPLAPHYPILVHHWHGAENPERERVYAGLAGEQAAKRYANEGAVRYLSRALELTPESEAEARYRLLLGREEVLGILGWRERQKEDLTALLASVAVGGSSQQYALVHLRQTLYAMNVTDYEAAQVSVRNALQQARAARDVTLEARSCQTWGRILRQMGNYPEALQRSHHALDLTRRAEDALSEARALYDIGTVHYFQTDYRTAQTYYKQALAIFDRLAFIPGQVDCLLVFGAIDNILGRYGEAQVCYKRALAISRAIGWRLIEVTALGNLGNNHFDLGDYAQARLYHTEAREKCAEIGDRWGEAISLDTLSLIHCMLQDYIAAVDCSHAAIAIQQETGDRQGLGYSLNHLGMALSGLGEDDAAMQVFTQAAAIHHELGQTGLHIDGLAALARIAQRHGDLAQAQLHIETLLARIRAHGTDGSEFPVWAYLTCYQVLRATAENVPERLLEAQNALREGYAFLQERASHIQDETFKRHFSDNVPFNRELVAMWQQECQ